MATVSCSNCHLNAGQRERALPLVGVAAAYPEMNRRAERQFTLEDRIIDCFMRSENGTEASTTLPTRETDEVVAVAAYLEWLSKGYESGKKPAWRGKNTIAADRLLPLSDARSGEGRGALPREVHGVPRARMARASRSATRKPRRSGTVVLE